MKQRIYWNAALRCWEPWLAGIPDPYITPRDLVMCVYNLNVLNGCVKSFSVERTIRNVVGLVPRGNVT